MAGAFVLLLLGAANRDPAQFENPDEYDITRNDDRHISFGHGIHFCLGAPLARMEGQIALRILTQRFRDLRLLTNSPPYKEQMTLRGLESLPVAFDPRTRGRTWYPNDRAEFNALNDAQPDLSSERGAGGATLHG